MMVSMSKKQPFEGAENAVKLSRECADVAIVTAANGSEIKKRVEKPGYFEIYRRSGISGERVLGRISGGTETFL